MVKFNVYTILLALCSFTFIGCEGRHHSKKKVFSNGTRVKYQLLNVEDFQKYALENIPLGFRDYLERGSGNEMTIKWNREDYLKYSIIPRALVDIRGLTTDIKINGKKLKLPVGAAPAGLHKRWHPHGEVETVKGVTAAGTIMILSTVSGYTIEEVAGFEPNSIRWLQTYIFRNRSITHDIIRRAEAAGYSAIVFVVDQPVRPIRYYNTQNNHSDIHPLVNLLRYIPEGSDLSKIFWPFDDTTWKDIKKLSEYTKLPVYVKGILNSEDAVLAKASGARGIIISNHGGRQLDCAMSTIEALQNIRQERPKLFRDAKFDIYLDGGIRSGGDIFKALALGAKFVFVGRAYLYGLAHSGRDGIESVFNILQKELAAIMAQTGCKSVADIGPSNVALRRHI